MDDTVIPTTEPGVAALVDWSSPPPLAEGRPAFHTGRMAVGDLGMRPTAAFSTGDEDYISPLADRTSVGGGGNMC